MRSPLARAMGLGSAKAGVEHWWMERVSAVALVPLTLWFVASIIAHTGSVADHAPGSKQPDRGRPKFALIWRTRLVSPIIEADPQLRPDKPSASIFGCCGMLPTLRITQNPRWSMYRSLRRLDGAPVSVSLPFY